MKIAEFKQALRPLREWFLDLIFPKECVGKCGSSSSYLCIDCIWKMAMLAQQSCPVCNRSNFWGEVCAPLCKRKTYLDRLLVVSNYHQNKILSEAIHIFKYRFAEDLGQNLALLMAKRFWHFFSSDRFLFVPVPLHPKRLMFRGFNQAEILATQLANTTGHPFYNLTKRVKYSKPQAELNGRQRRKSLVNAFQLHHVPPPDQHIILVDDVYTTGTTLNECARVLKINGVQQITGLVLARSSLPD